MRDALERPDRLADLAVSRTGAPLELLARDLEHEAKRDLEHDPLDSLIRPPVGEKGAADGAD